MLTKRAGGKTKMTQAQKNNNKNTNIHEEMQRKAKKDIERQIRPKNMREKRQKDKKALTCCGRILT